MIFCHDFVGPRLSVLFDSPKFPIFDCFNRGSVFFKLVKL